MKYTDLPASELLLTTDGADVVASALTAILMLDQDECITHLSPVSGAAYSIRIFSKWDHPDSVKLPRASTPAKVGMELARLAQSEARYNPPVNPNGRKGWEIRKGKIDGKPIAIACATWI